MYVHYILILRLLSKAAENGVSNVADDVKAHVRRIAQSTTEEAATKALAYLISWDRYNGNLKRRYTYILHLNFNQIFIKLW